MATANTSSQASVAPFAKPLRTSGHGSSSRCPFKDAYFPPENPLPFRFWTAVYQWDPFHASYDILEQEAALLKRGKLASNCLWFETLF
jgi:hypothetical protein